MFDFLKKQPLKKEPIMGDYEKQQKEREDRINRLKLQAETMKSSVLAEQHPRLLKFKADHEKDLSLYEFRCERYGDFLAVFIKRGDTLERTYYWQRDSNKIVSALSLMNSREIKLNEGQAPNILESASFISRFNHEKRDYEVIIKYTDYYHPRPILDLDPAPQTSSNAFCGYGGSGDEYIGVTVDGCSAPARDDTIRFEGCGATIFVPFGKGQEIHDKILAAIKLPIG